MKTFGQMLCSVGGLCVFVHAKCAQKTSMNVVLGGACLCFHTSDRLQASICLTVQIVP